MTNSHATTPTARLTSMDAYRGLVMLLMMAEVLHVGHVAAGHPGSAVWKFIAFHFSHVPWTGCSLHDLIQPSFSFLVGVALPFSIASRKGKGQSALVMTMHALWRSLILILLGVFLRSIGGSETNWTFEDTLTQIGLGYPFLFALGFTKPRVQVGALAVVLFGYWSAWAIYPVPGADFDYARVGVPADWAHHANGFAAHWNKNSNLGAAFDQWFLNLFPRKEPFIFNSGGYLTLSFIPTLGTMVLGLLAGGWLKSDLPRQAKINRMIVSGAICIIIGIALHLLGVCPIVKRIWTPGWTLFSGGMCFLMLAAFYVVIDVGGWKRWSFPLVVVGMNSIAAYCIVHLGRDFVAGTFRTHLGPNAFNIFGEPSARFFEGVAVLGVFWVMLFWMYRRKLFLKV